MPIYAYRCATCGHAQDVLQKMSDPLLTTCPVCGAEAFSKQLTAAGFQLKGSGWYVTDFRGGKKPEADAKEGAKGDGKSDGASDVKSDAKSDAKPDKAGNKGDAAIASKPDVAAKPAADNKAAASTSTSSPAPSPPAASPPPSAKS